MIGSGAIWLSRGQGPVLNFETKHRRARHGCSNLTGSVLCGKIALYVAQRPIVAHKLHPCSKATLCLPHLHARERRPACPPPPAYTPAHTTTPPGPT